jgi:light-regulated signal transduction histidine kinase (bacteriophytochrome)
VAGSVDRATTELQQRNDELLRSNQELDEFAAIAAHDLKEPLRGIRSYATFLLEEYGTPLGADGQARLRSLQSLAVRLDAQLEALLQFARVGQVELALQETDLNRLVQEVLEDLHLALRERQVQVRIPRPLPVVRCDPVRVAEVFLNLLTNAMKYTDRKERWIEIGADTRHRPIVVHVRDNGIGIPRKQFDVIFRIFQRLHGRGAYGGGTGAGLTIVKKIIERHGGRIWLDSVVGEGTTFHFTLEGDRDEPANGPPSAPLDR